MSKAHFSLSNFQAKVGGSALARTNRFEVIISPPKAAFRRDDSELTSLFCEVSNLPPLNINVKPFKMYGPNHQRPVSSDYGGDGLSMTFHLDSSMSIKRFFDDWMESIVIRDSFNVSYQNNYVTTILLKQLRPSTQVSNEYFTNDGGITRITNNRNFNIDEGLANNTLANPSQDKDDVMYEIELLEAFPRSMNIVEFNNSAQNQTQRLTVVFAYRYWRRTDIAKSLEAKIPTSTVAVLPQKQVNAITPPKPIKNVTFTGVFSPGTTNEDMAFGVGGGII